MSYNPQPEWATVILHYDPAALRCPNCNLVIGHMIVDAFARAQTADYYKPAHIPPRLLFDCPGCEEDLSVVLRVAVHVERPPEKEAR